MVEKTGSKGTSGSDRDEVQASARLHTRAGRTRCATAAFMSLALGACAHVKPLPPGEALTKQERREAIRRATVWSPTDVAARDIKAGPDPKGYAFDEWVACEHEKKKPSSGVSRKFLCLDDAGKELKVKYDNAEVFGEVMATRLFWALGFAADTMYPVRVRCHGCPQDPIHDKTVVGGGAVFDPATIEHKLDGRAMEATPDSGWKWSEFDDIGPDAPVNARATRDALKLLAAFVQHTDSKAPNQRIVCPEGAEIGATGCGRPILMIQDLGLTFGRATLRNHNSDSANLANWSGVPLWSDRELCIAHNQRSFTGGFSYPHISEAGRAFLADLLMQLTDAQIRDLFEVGRVTRRGRNPKKANAAPGTVEEWVKTFKHRRSEIVDARCPQ
jgi:hypothetical protein